MDLDLEFMDMVSSGDFDTGTVSTASGGTITIIVYAEQSFYGLVVDGRQWVKITSPSRLHHLTWQDLPNDQLR